VYERGEAGRATPDADVVSASPQPPQNFSPGAFANPHEEHGLGSGAPHWAQNLRPVRFPWSHCMQRDEPVREDRSVATRASVPTAGYGEVGWRNRLPSLVRAALRSSSVCLLLHHGPQIPDPVPGSEAQEDPLVTPPVLQIAVSGGNAGTQNGPTAPGGTTPSSSHSMGGAPRIGQR